MKKRLHIFLLFFFLCISSIAFSSHIVGGTLTYVHNGGSSYTITLKLFRDCAAGTAGFDGSVSITVLGNNGAITGKNFTMTNPVITIVPPTLPPCAIAPATIPCVEQGIYTKTVTNLTPAAGGYHLYWQRQARNIGVNNCDTDINNCGCLTWACLLCVGSSFYADIPGPPVVNSNPVFNQFPPLFLCAGQPFTFDHSATDVNGDSLVYSFYTPFNGDNAQPGALDPTFPGNIASFTPIVWLPGYSATNPLGGTPLNLNASTGLLTGTPSMIGKFIVGVKVKDYRNGIYMSQTLRDFQFTVLNCPQPPPPLAGPDIAVNQGCSSQITASGYTESTVTWNSVYPGAVGAYNSYLSCTSGCLTPTATAQNGAPPYVDYQICGTSSACNAANVCDIVRITFNSTLGVTIVPQNPVLCVGQSSTTLTATGSGGTPPYSYLWNNVNPAQSIIVGNGTYTVKLSDASGCPPAYSTVTVTTFSVAISANAGVDQTVCKQNPVTTLNASVTGCSGGSWSGGAGTFSPGNTTLSATYSPSAAELTAGFVDLTLTTTGNGNCAPASDVVRINYVNFSGLVSFTQTPVSCFGGNDGSATVNIAGGTPPYSYSWNTAPAQSTATATNLPLGTYAVTITNAIGCTSTNSVAITQPSPLALASSITHVTCSGGNNGFLSIIPTGGTGPYTYLWSNASTASQISNLTSQSYTVTVTDSKACQLSSTYTITEPSPITLSLAPTNVSCFNGSNGTVSSTVSGGTSPYTYNWTSGATSPGASGLQAGAYTLTVTDNFGCLASNSVTITQPTALAASTSTTNETCNPANDGTATAVASGGTPGYTYLWSNGATTSNISNLTSQTYTLTTTDSKGCTATVFATITEPASLTINFISQVNVSCFGGNNGVVTASPAGGTPGYTYSWSNGSTTSQISNLSAQIYTVTVTDSKGCVITNSVTITQPTALAASTTSTDETCGSLNNGAAAGAATGGSPSYTYLWQPDLQTSSSISNLPTGTYTLTVTDSKGCTATAFATITEPAPLTVLFTSITNVSCFTGSDGTVTASESGGTPGYNFLWTPGNATIAKIENISAGTYTVIVTDNFGCTATNSIVITQPAALSASTSVINATCNNLNDGTAMAILSGGTPGYTYLWQPGSLNTLIINSLSDGTYTLTVTDSEGCTATTNAVITEPPPLAISFTSPTNVSCFGGNDGSITASPTGGTPNYSYLWSNGSTASQISNLTSQIYTVTVTDAKGCITTDAVTITQPLAPLSVFVSSLPATCYGGTDGSVSSSATGGTGPYTYLWSNGSTASQISNLTSQIYTVTASDSEGCITTNPVTVIQPAQIVLTTSSVNSDCGQPNGQTSVSVSGGNAPYSYLWSPSGGTNDTAIGLVSGAYTVVVTDFTGCSASQFGNVDDNSAPVAGIFSVINVSCYGGATGSAKVATSGGIGPFTYSWAPYGGNDSTATGLTAGSYTVTVTGANGCQSLATTSPDITQPPPILITVTKSTVSCFGGNDATASAIASGGTAGYAYLWLPGGSTASQISNLTSQIYTVKVTDTNSCVKTEPFTITEPSAALSVSLSFTPVSCYGGADGSVSASAAGGTAPYNYSWMPGNFNGQNLSNLAAGTYTLTLTDSKGCIYFDSIIVTQPALLILITDSINSNCSLPNGQASVGVSGGAGAYLYQWAPSGGNNDTAGALLSGSYNVTVTDGNGCISTAGITINDNASPVATVTSTTNVTCNAGSNGTATVSVAGGVEPFTYSWIPSGGADSIASGLTVGSYTVTVTDFNLCQSLPAVSPEITQPFPILISVTKTSVSCFGGNDGTASVIASGGIPGYAYQWLPGGTTGTSITNLSATTYTIQVTDTNSCVQTLPVIINEPLQLTPVISSITNVSCFGQTNGEATVIANGGTPVYSYDWLPAGGNGSTGTGLSIGTYTITITDFNGCITSDSVTITEPSQALSATNTASSGTCYGTSNATIGIHAAGGTPAYSYLWNPSVSTNDTASGLASGNYTILVTDSNSCQTNISVDIVEPAALNGTLVAINPSCGLSNGSISLQLSGGTAPYTYLWAPDSSTTPGINNLDPGIYSLQIKDAFNCALSLSSNLINVPGPSVAISSISTISCYGGNDGSASISITQGTAPYTINWTPSGGNSLTASSLGVGAYTVNITDALGCQTVDSVIINEPTPVDVSISSISNVLCNGGNTGTITATAIGGSPPYTYIWSNGGITSQISNLTSQTYTVNVKDQNNCLKAISAAITEPTLLSSIDSITHAICFNGFGSASIVASGGILPYSYSWSAPAAGQTGSTVNNLISGSYIVTVTDSNGCVTNNNVLITQPSQVITTSGVNDTLCLGQSGSITATAAGGAGNYNYAWQPSGAITSGTLPITPTSDITYTVVAYDQIGCAGTPDSITAVVYNLTGANIQIYGTTPICPGQSSAVYVETSGITGPLTCLWNNNLEPGTGIHLVTPAQPTTYIVTVSNSCGLTVIDSVAVLFNSPPTIDLTSGSDTLCAPGIMPFFDNSVTGNLNDEIIIWDWNFGDGTTSAEENPEHTYYQADTYPVTLTVTTGGGCTNNNLSTPLTITAHPSPTAAFSLYSTNVDLPYDELICYNQSTGANAYNWSFGNGETSTLFNPRYVYTSVGVFQVQLIAENQYGCLDTARAEVTADAEVIFPNVFSPNSDGATGGSYNINNLDNDVFFPYTSGVVDFKLEIFNRWGEQIFESLDIKQGWDGYYRGALCQQDVYIWKAYIKLNNGKTFNKNGNLTLLR